MYKKYIYLFTQGETGLEKVTSESQLVLKHFFFFLEWLDASKPELDMMFIKHVQRLLFWFDA